MKVAPTAVPSLAATALVLTLGCWLVGLPRMVAATEHYARDLGILTTEQGREAPDFALTDSAGKVHRLSDYRGKVVLLSFGTTW